MLFDKQIDNRMDESAASRARSDLTAIADEFPEEFMEFLKERLFRSLLDGTAPTLTASGPLPEEPTLSGPIL